MAPLVRTFWLLSCPLLLASAVVHVPLERAGSAEIEHNMEFEGKHRRLLSETPDPGTPARHVALQFDAQIVSGQGRLNDFPGSWIGCSDVGQDAFAQRIAFLLTIRLLV